MERRRACPAFFILDCSGFYQVEHCLSGSNCFNFHRGTNHSISGFFRQQRLALAQDMLQPSSGSLRRDYC